MVLSYFKANVTFWLCNSRYIIHVLLIIDITQIIPPPQPMIALKKYKSVYPGTFIEYKIVIGGFWRHSIFVGKYGSRPERQFNYILVCKNHTGGLSKHQCTTPNDHQRSKAGSETCLSRTVSCSATCFKCCMGGGIYLLHSSACSFPSVGWGGCDPIHIRCGPYYTKTIYTGHS